MNKTTIKNVSVELSIKIGKATLTVGEIQNLKSGSVIPLDHSDDNMFTLESNGQVIAKGNVENVDGKLMFVIASVEGE